MELKILAKNTVMLASPKVIKFIVGIIRAKFIAVFLGVVGAGIIDQLQDIIGKIRSISLSSLPDGMVKLIAHQNGIEFDVKKISNIVKTYLTMVIPTAIIMTALGFIYADEITIYIFGDIKYKLYFLIGFIAFPFAILSTTSSALLKAFKEVKSFAISEALIITINLLIFIPLVYFYKVTGGVIYVTLSFVSTFIVMFYLMNKNVLKKNGIKFRDIKNAVFSKIHFKELLGYMGVGLIGGTYFIFTEITTRAIVVNQLGIDKLGLYTPITRWANLFVGFILPSIYTYLYPRLSEAKSNNEITLLLNDVIRLITFITLPFVIVGISTRQWIIPVFYSKDFMEATIYLPYHFATLIVVIWSSILSQLFYATGRLKQYLIFGLILNSISLGVVYFLVPYIGLYGYLAKFTIIPLLMLTGYYFFWEKEVEFKVKNENIKIIIYAVLCSIVLLVVKDISILLQLISILLIISMIFLLKKKEKDFLLKKIKGLLKKKN